MKCARNGCDNPASAVVVFNNYDDNENTQTHACQTHAHWWTKGAYGVRIGRVRLLSQR